MPRRLFVFSLLFLASVNVHAERWVRADLESKSYRIDLDDRDLIAHLTLRSALPAQAPEWLIPADNVSEPASITRTAPFTADFRMNIPVDDMIADFRRRLTEHGYAVTSIVTDEPRITGNQAVQSVTILLQPNDDSTTGVHILYTHHAPRDSGQLYLEAEAYDVSLKGLVVRDRPSGCEFLISDAVLDRFNKPVTVVKVAASAQRTN